MASDDRFKQAVITTLAKRAANRCSNPDCGAITSGPTDDPHDSVNVGEAAHIFGAHPGSARYDSSMSPSERSAISNAIWLCSNCHKIIDDDANKYPAGLLFEWQQDHERRIAAQVGKVSAEIRFRYEKRHLEEFGRLSHLSERLILEKGDSWEYLLTAEVLRFEMAPIIRRWTALDRGLYIKPNVRIEKRDFTQWSLSRLDEISAMTSALSQLINVEFSRVWGEPGVPGNDVEIVTTCRLFSELCQRALDWEETVRFVSTDELFSELHHLYVGVAGHIIDEAAKVPRFMSETFASGSATGTHELKLKLALPDGWIEEVSAATKRAKRAMA